MLQTDLMFGPLGAACLVLLSTVLVFIFYSSNKLKYWKKRGIQHPKPLPLFGSMLEVLLKPIHEVEKERYFKYGRIYGHYEGNRPLLSVADPALLRDILVKDFHIFPSRRDFKVGNEIVDKMVSVVTGEDWKRIRTIVTPTFTTGKIKRMVGIFKECAATTARSFRKAAERGEPIDAKSLYGAFTMDVIASSAFSTKIDSHNDPNNEFVVTARNVFTRNINWRFLLFIIWPKFMKFFKIDVFAPKAVSFFHDVTLRIIEERKKMGQTRNDFLQLLTDTANEVVKEGKLDIGEKEGADIASNYGKIDSDQIIRNIVIKKSLSMNELVAQCVIFFLAGYDTTASTLSFTSYLLAIHPDIQEKLIQELDEALAATNGELTYEAVQNMKYLDNVISETMRLYPPAIRLERTAEQDYKLGESGITVPKGMVVTIPIYAMHRDPEFFPDPEKFDPDRFSPEQRAKRDQYTYLPFGAGPRNCVGMRFALMEIKVCLAYVLSHFRIKRCPETKVPLDFFIGQGLLQPKAILLKMEPRTDGIRAH